MVDWVAGLADASISERDSGYILVRVPGSPDVLKESPVTQFVTKDASDNVGIGVSAAYRFHVRLQATGLLAEFASEDGVRNPRLQFSGNTDGFVQNLTYSTTANQHIFAIANVYRLWISDSYVSPGLDNAQTSGDVFRRWSVVWANTGSISTSDEREKTWRGGITTAEYAAGRAIIAELGFYQWNEEVDKKGADSARFHFGARAQRVWSICAEHGFAPKIRKNGVPEKNIVPPAFLCFDEWDEQKEDVMEDVEVEVDEEGTAPTGKLVEVDGQKFELHEAVIRKVKRMENRATGQKRVSRKAGNRYGFRADQLNAFLIAVQARRQDEIDARLAALEAV